MIDTIILKVCAFGYHTGYHVNNTYMIPYIPDTLLYDSSYAIMLKLILVTHIHQLNLKQNLGHMPF